MLEINTNLSSIDLKFRVKRSQTETFEKATAEGNYDYWLTQEDIADIARILYSNYRFPGLYPDPAGFEILGSMQQLGRQIERFQNIVSNSQLERPRITFIINLANQHWVTLVIIYQNRSYNAYYMDSLGIALSEEVSRHLLAYGIRPIRPLAEKQQTDASNCGLWALENAYDLNKMLYENKPLDWVIGLLKSPRDSSYFILKRQLLSRKLGADLIRNTRLRDESIDTSPQSEINSEPNSKRIKLPADELDELSESFVETFISECVKRITAARIIARGQGLTEHVFINEIKTTTMAALLGAAIAQSQVGTIPSVVASIRRISSEFPLPKSKAQKTTNAFSNVPPNSCNQILAEAALEVFQSFSSQFIQVTDKAGKQIAIEKLAEDAASRLINYIAKNWQDEAIKSEFITQGVLLGESECYFDPSIKKIQLRRIAYSIQDNEGNSVNTADLYEETGWVVQIENQAKRFYKKANKPNSDRYGYRLPLSWEKNENGELKRMQDYQQVTSFEQETAFQLHSRTYAYLLQQANIPEKVTEIIQKLNNKYPDLPPKVSKKTSILFNLRKPVSTFTGRRTVLTKLHEILTSDATAIVTNLSRLSIAPSSSQIASSSSQVSLSGLGVLVKPNWLYTMQSYMPDTMIIIFYGLRPKHSLI